MVEFLLVEVFLQEIDRIGIIINDQDPFSGSGLSGAAQQAVEQVLLAQIEGTFECRQAGGFAVILDRDEQGKGRSFPQFAFNRHISAQQAGQVAADGKPQAGTAILAGGAGVGLLEFLEDAGQGFVADADAGIADSDVQVFSALWAESRMLPWWVNLVALLSRFSTICRILSWSE